eukprot:5331525-Heterocapsa_arctica.AAC.1
MPRSQVTRMHLRAHRGRKAAACVSPFDRYVAQQHREKVAKHMCPFNACVARPVSKAEIANNAGARAALDSEWKRLRDKHVWDETVV